MISSGDFWSTGGKVYGRTEKNDEKGRYADKPLYGYNSQLLFIALRFIVFGKLFNPRLDHQLCHKHCHKPYNWLYRPDEKDIGQPVCKIRPEVRKALYEVFRSLTVRSYLHPCHYLLYGFSGLQDSCFPRSPFSVPADVSAFSFDQHDRRVYSDIYIHAVFHEAYP